MNMSLTDRRKNIRALAMETGIRVLLFGVFVLTEFLEPFERVIQPEELWLYKNPLVESDHIPKRVMFAISFLTPLAVIFVVKIIQRTDKTEIKEACLGTPFPPRRLPRRPPSSHKLIYRHVQPTNYLSQS
uniref:Phospholipid phosphatase 4 n=1 Tax=Hucho hucho TaxID=62062 RepID=A0A4W5QV66_9TELE